MTRVDFYILADTDLAAMQRFACRLAAKAVAQGQQVHIHSGDADQSAEVDELLWHYPPQRFLPHSAGNRAAGPRDTAAPISLDWRDPGPLDDVLINLSDNIPDFFGRFGRVAEIIVGARKDLGRTHYKYYRDRGYPLHHHELDDWES